MKIIIVKLELIATENWIYENIFTKLIRKKLLRTYLSNLIWEIKESKNFETLMHF